MTKTASHSTNARMSADSITTGISDNCLPGNGVFRAEFDPAQARAPDRCRPRKSTIRAELAAWQVEIQALAVVVLPVVFLTWKEGGVDRFDQTVVFGWGLLAAGAPCLRSKQRGVTACVPWAAAVMAVIPLLQIIPPADLQHYLLSVRPALGFGPGSRRQAGLEGNPVRQDGG